MNIHNSLLSSTRHARPWVGRLPGAILLGALIWAAGAAPTTAASIPVLNYSFENPAVNSPGFPVNIDIENWLETDDPRPQPQPVPWSFGTGNFPNPDVGSTGHYNSIDGNRAAYILASMGQGFYQDLTSPQGIFTIGEAYLLTVGLSATAGTPGGSQNDNSTPGPVVLVPGSTVLSLSLYYRVGGVMTSIPGATTPVSAFPDTNTFVDYTVTVPKVLASDAWAGKPIGILLKMTTVTAENGGFDVENVRVETVPEPGSALLAGLAMMLLAGGRRVRRL